MAMKNHDADKISALVDNELGEWELRSAVESLRHDPVNRDCWCNYHLIGDAMRGTLPRYVCTDLTDRINLALEHEPVYLKTNATSVAQAAVTPQRSRATVGFALAASMSAVAVFGVMMIDRDSSVGGQQVAVAASESRSPGAQSLPVMSSTLLNEMLAAGEVDEPRTARIQTVSGAGMMPLATDLNEYLMNYHRYSMPRGNDDPLNYLRVVSHGSGQ